MPLHSLPPLSLPLLALSSLITLACAGHANVSAQPAGTAGSAGASGSAGADALLPPEPITNDPATLGASPVKCAGVPTPAAPLVRSCVLVAGCVRGIRPTALSDCIAQALPDSGAFPACIVGAQSCAEMDACLGAGFYPDACPTGVLGPICVGTKLVQCNALGPRYFTDCAKLDALCAAYSTTADGGVDAADCAVTPSCGTPSDKYVCDGTKRVRCQQGIGFGEDCAAHGLGCVETPDGAVCAQTPSCASPGTGSCNGAGKGTFCQADGQLLSIDCGRLGFDCQAAPDQAQGIACVNPTCPKADVAQCFEECDGPMAHLCLGGQRFSIDCQNYGFLGCILETRPDGGDRARCGDY